MARSSSDGSAKTGSALLARLIRDRREELGLSRQDLADRTGVPYPTIAQIETAYRGVSPSRLGTIARTLGLDPAELYEALATDTPSAASQPASRARPTTRARGDWLPNPAYAPPAEAAPPASDVVERVVALLSELPPRQRLDALGRVQSGVLSGLVEEEVRQATERPRQS